MDNLPDELISTIMLYVLTDDMFYLTNILLINKRFYSIIVNDRYKQIWDQIFSFHKYDRKLLTNENIIKIINDGYIVNYTRFDASSNLHDIYNTHNTVHNIHYTPDINYTFLTFKYMYQVNYLDILNYSLNLDDTIVCYSFYRRNRSNEAFNKIFEATSAQLIKTTYKKILYLFPNIKHIFTETSNSNNMYPFNFDNLYNVEEIDLCNNELICIPDNGKITELHCEVYDVRTLESISKLSKLTKLNISRGITNPKHIEYIVSIKLLTTLELNNCNITYLPDSFAELKLTHVCLNNNKLMEIPQCLSKIETLEHLEIRENYIHDAQNIAGCKNLKYLDLGVNKITILPDELFEITSLEELYLDLKLKKYPEKIKNLVNLRYLRSVIEINRSDIPAGCNYAVIF